MRIATLAVNLAAILAITGLGACSSRKPTDPSRELNALVESYFDELLPFEPVYATFIGEHAYDDRLANNLSPEYLRQRREFEARYLAAIREIPVESLDTQERLTHAIFVSEREQAVRRLDFPGHLLPIDQLYSVPQVLAVLGSGSSAQPFATVADYDRFLGRLGDFPAWAAQAIINMRAGMESGVVQPRVVVEAALQQLKELGESPVEESVFYGPVKSLPPGFMEEERQRLKAQYTMTLRDTVLPRYRELAAFLEKEYLPAARETVAWTALPQGGEWYAFLAATSTTTTMMPEEIHELGLQEVARIRAEMEGVRRQVGFEGDLKAFFRHLGTDPKFYFDNAAELLQGYRDLKTNIDARLPNLFATLPAIDYEVREVEAFRAESAAGASYQPPSPDGSRPGIFYVNTFNLRAQPRFGMETLSLHEAAPGHHFQQSIQLRLDGLPRFRRFGGDYVAYVEGWALYAESLGPELGMFTDPYQYYGRLNDEMLRAMRLVVDTGLHTRGWSREQANAYMLDNSSLAESDVRSEVDRYIANPGQALGYKIGEIRIRALRRKAEATLGEVFDVRQFHDVILRDGALPIDVLEAKVDGWLAGFESGGGSGNADR